MPRTHMVEEVADKVLNATVMNKRFAKLILETPLNLDDWRPNCRHVHTDTTLVEALEEAADGYGEFDHVFELLFLPQGWDTLVKVEKRHEEHMFGVVPYFVARVCRRPLLWQVMLNDLPEWAFTSVQASWSVYGPLQCDMPFRDIPPSLLEPKTSEYGTLADAVELAVGSENKGCAFDLFYRRPESGHDDEPVFKLRKNTRPEYVHANSFWVWHRDVIDLFQAWAVFDKPYHDVPDNERRFKRCVNPSGEHAEQNYQKGYCFVGRQLLHVKKILTAPDSTKYKESCQVYRDENFRREMALFIPFAVDARGVLVVARTAYEASELRNWLTTENRKVDCMSGWAWTRIVDSCRADAWKEITRTGVRTIVATAASCLARTGGKKRAAPDSEEEDADCTRPPKGLDPHAKEALSKASIDMLIVMDPPKGYVGSQCELLVESFRSMRAECGGRCMVLVMRDKP